MKNNNNNIKKIFRPNSSVSAADIETYLDGTISKEDQRKVENAIIDNPLVAEAVEGYQKHGFSYDKDQARSQLTKMIQRLESQSTDGVVPIQSTKVWRQLAVAASFLIVVGALVWMVFAPSATTNEALYATYYESFESDLPSFRGGTDGDEITTLQLFERGVESYRNGDYEESIPFFEEYLAIDSDNHFATFYGGMANLEANNIDRAITLFNQTIAIDNIDYDKEAKWYLILAHLKNGDRTKAMEQLEQYVAEGVAFKQEQAKRLLEQLAH